MSRLRGTARAVLVPLALAGMVACAGPALGRIYDGGLLPRLLAGAAAGSVLLSALTRRLPGWTAGPLSGAALFGYTLIAMRVSARAGDVPGGLAEVTADAARNGIPRLLTALIPIEPQPDTVLVPVVAAWLAGLAGAELAVRGGRVLLGTAPPALCFAGALYLVGPNAPAALWPTAAFAGFAALALAVSGRGRPPEDAGAAGSALPRLRLGAGAAAGVVLLAALAAAIGPAVAGRVATTPDDPRRHVVPPRLDALDENPLVRLSAWAVNPSQHLLDARVDRDTRLRLAVLSDYDGITWRVGATYRSAGRSLPRSTEVTVDTATDDLRQQITVADLSGHLLPAVGAPRRVDGVRVAYDTASGTLIRPDGLVPGLRYTVVSEHPRPDVNLLPGAEVPAGPEVARLLHVAPGVPEELERLGRQLVEGNAGAYQRATAIEAFLAEHYRLVPDAPSGHAYPNLGFFLFGPRHAGGQRGTSEQFAASFAVLGRLAGLPTRVVVGFSARAGTAKVTGADALAWPEVLFTGIGWVAFHPLPRGDTPQRPVEEDFRPKPETSAPPPSAVPTVDVSLPPPSIVAVPAPPAGSGAVPWRAIGVVLGAPVGLLALAVLVGVPLLRRADRRRRLDLGPPSTRVAGAWWEVRDALRLAGRPAPAHLSASEVATHAAAAAGLPRSAHRRQRVRLPAPPLEELAGVVNLGTYGPAPVREEEASRARAQAVAYIAELRARQPRWRRLLWTLHPGPLRWSRRRGARSHTVH